MKRGHEIGSYKMRAQGTFRSRQTGNSSIFIGRLNYDGVSVVNHNECLFVSYLQDKQLKCSYS